MESIFVRNMTLNCIHHSGYIPTATGVFTSHPTDKLSGVEPEVQHGCTSHLNPMDVDGRLCFVVQTWLAKGCKIDG